MSDTAFDAAINGGFVSSLNAARNKPSEAPKFTQVIIQVFPSQLGNPTLYLPANPTLFSDLITAIEAMTFPSLVPPFNYTGARYVMKWQNNASGVIYNVRFVLETDQLLTTQDGHYIDEFGNPPTEWGWVRSFYNYRTSIGRTQLSSLELSKSRLVLKKSKFPACINREINGVRSCTESRLLAPSSGDRWSHDGSVILLKAPTPPAQIADVWTEYLRADVRESVSDPTPLPPCCNIAP